MFLINRRVYQSTMENTAEIYLIIADFSSPKSARGPRRFSTFVPFTDFC